MDFSMLVNIIVGGVIGWLSGYLPFVKQIDAGNMTRVITNVIFGVIGGGVGASLFDGGALVELIGSILGAGFLSAISPVVINKLRK